MKSKQYLVIIIFIIIYSNILKSQSCLPNGITFTTQQQIDDFPTDYPNCSEIEGDVIISESTSGEITNLNGLSQIVTIFGDLTINSNFSLIDISGLNNLDSIGNHFNLMNNNSLENLPLFDFLTSIGGGILIMQNSQLLAINGFNNLNSIPEELKINENGELLHISGFDDLISVSNDLIIENNSQLSDITLNSLTSVGGNIRIANTQISTLNGFNNLNFIGSDLGINDNDELINLSGLNNLNSIEGGLGITYNNALINFEGLSNLFSINQYVEIIGNASLTSLSGMQNLSFIGSDIYISSNEELTDLTALSDFTTINGNLSILSNDNLISLLGLDNITAIEGFLNIGNNNVLENLLNLENVNYIGGYLKVVNNDALLNLTGLESLTEIAGYLMIKGNSNLISLSGIHNINPNSIDSNDGYKDLTIRNNNSLSECEVQSICDFLYLPNKTKEIHDNKTGCDTEQEVIDACDGPDCTFLIDPINGSNNVNITTDLIWEEKISTNGYKLTIGTSSGSGNIMENEDVGNVTTFDPGDFPCGSIIYITITPYNIAGEASGCAEENFTTENVTVNAGPDTEYCSGESTQLNASGGTTYSWSPSDGLDDPNIANPIANPDTTTIYTVTVSNDGRCPETDVVVVTVNSNPVPNATATDETANDANDGTATCNPTNGIPTYTYIWSNSENTQTITELAPGEYTVTVYDYNDCSAEGTVTVEEFICPELNINFNQQNVDCYNNCNGSIEVNSVENGTLPLNYLWSTGSVDSFINNLCTGSYEVSITDATNCTISDTFEITEPSDININISSTNETANDANDGTATCNPSGGIAPYNYLWNTGDTTQTIINLSPGIYYVTVNDSNGCMKTDSTEVLEFGCNSLSINTIQDNVLCFGDCNGKLSISNVQNGTPPYSYTWNTGDTTSFIDSLCIGYYNVTVQDSYGCIIIGSYQIISPEMLNANATSTDETSSNANDGTASVSPTGGVYPYSVLWNTGDTSRVITGLSPGQYFVTVTDHNLCEDLDTVIVSPFGCSGLIVNSQQIDVSCGGLCDGVIAINSVSNSTPPLSYSWNTGSNSSLINNLCAGTYMVTINDAANCSVIDTFQIFTQNEIIITVDTIIDITSNGLGAILITTNDNGHYSYKWNGPNGYSNNHKDILNLNTKGCYNLEVTDGNSGCTIDTTICIEDYTSTLDFDAEDINIYPNPTKSDFIIDFTNTNISQAIITMYNISGTKVLELEKPENDKIINVDHKFLNPGLFIIRIKSEINGTVYRKIMIDE